MDGRSDRLDGLRALAALSVLAFHVWLYRDDRPHALGDRGVLDHVLFELNLGLVCFFVLSGFLLHRAFARAALLGGRPVDARRYALRRAARILPAYYACAAGCLVLFAAVGYTAITPRAVELPAFALLAQNYRAATIMQLNPVTWTLGVEAAFYLVLPMFGLLALWAARRRPMRQTALLTALVGTTLLWNALAVRHGWSAVAAKALPAYLGYFALGMLAALWIEHRGIAGRPPLTPAVTAAIAGVGLGLVVALAWWHETSADLLGTRRAVAALPAALGFALVIAAVAGGRGRAVTWLAWRPLALVGVVSYGVYLWHLPLLLAVREAGALPGPLAPRLAIVAGLALVVATVSWLVVERPAIRWAHARATRPPAGRPQPEATARTRLTP